MKPFDESLLTAYLDDELTDEERRSVEEHLANDATLRGLMAELRSVRELVQGLGKIAASPDMTSKVLAEVTSSDWNDVKPTIIESTVVRAETPDKPTRWLWTTMAIVAASVIALLFSPWWLSSRMISWRPVHDEPALTPSPESTSLYFDTKNQPTSEPSERIEFGTEAKENVEVVPEGMSTANESTERESFGKAPRAKMPEGSLAQGAGPAGGASRGFTGGRGGGLGSAESGLGDLVVADPAMAGKDLERTDASEDLHRSNTTGRFRESETNGIANDGRFHLEMQVPAPPSPMSKANAATERSIPTPRMAGIDPESTSERWLYRELAEEVRTESSEEANEFELFMAPNLPREALTEFGFQAVPPKDNFLENRLEESSPAAFSFPLGNDVKAKESIASKERGESEPKPGEVILLGITSDRLQEVVERFQLSKLDAPMVLSKDSLADSDRSLALRGIVLNRDKELVDERRPPMLESPRQWGELPQVVWLKVFTQGETITPGDR